MRAARQANERRVNKWQTGRRQRADMRTALARETASLGSQLEPLAPAGHRGQPPQPVCPPGCIAGSLPVSQGQHVPKPARRPEVHTEHCYRLDCLGRCPRRCAGAAQLAAHVETHGGIGDGWQEPARPRVGSGSRTDLIARAPVLARAHSCLTCTYPDGLGDGYSVSNRSGRGQVLVKGLHAGILARLCALVGHWLVVDKADKPLRCRPPILSSRLLQPPRPPLDSTAMRLLTGGAS